MMSSVHCLAALLVLAAPAAREDSPGFIGVQIKANTDGPGVIVVEVLAGGPADKAELKANDLITKVDGKDIESLQGFVSTIRETKAGTKLKLTVMRDAVEKTIEVTVGKQPEK
jgi:S1-C subfamily serine protease